MNATGRATFEREGVGGRFGHCKKPPPPPHSKSNCTLLTQKTSVLVNSNVFKDTFTLQYILCFRPCCSKSERTLRVVRVELNDGQRLVGLRYPEVLIAEVTALLSEQKAADAVLVCLMTS